MPLLSFLFFLQGLRIKALTLSVKYHYPLHEFFEAEKIYDTNTIINLIISVVFEN
jgi:hypothetical protein